MIMKQLLIIPYLFLSFFSFTQEFKQKEEFKSNIDSCFLGKVKFSKNSGFYLKLDFLNYKRPTHSEYVHSRNERYGLSFSFTVDSIMIEIKRIKGNYWYYSEKQDSTSLIKGFFSIDRSNFEIPIGNYEFEVFPLPIDMEDDTRYFDTLYTVLKQGDWIEGFDEFSNRGNYRNNLKNSDWSLYNIKYYYILLEYETFKNDRLITESLIQQNVIDNPNYFLGSWKWKHGWKLQKPCIVYQRNSKQHIYFKKDYYIYHRRCGNSPKPIEHKWVFNRNEMTLFLQEKTYKIIYSTEEEFVLVEIK
jgi:hypothetical protein